MIEDYLYNVDFVHKFLRPFRSKEFCVKFVRRLKMLGSGHLRQVIPDAPKNKEKEMAIAVLLEPDSLMQDFENMDPDTGDIFYEEYDHTAAAYSDGTWHPELLFTQSKHNAVRVHHQDLDVYYAPYTGDKPKYYQDGNYNFGTGHVSIDGGQGYRSYDNNAIGNGIFDQSQVSDRLGNRYRNDLYTSKGNIPHWQYSVMNTPYDRTSEGLRDAGRSDRRLLDPRGYAPNNLLLARRADKYRPRPYYR